MTQAASTSESVTTYGQLQKLAENFWIWRAQNQPVSSDDIPRIERPRDWVPDWSRKTIERRREELADLTRRWRELDPKSWPIDQRVDYRLIGSALARVHWELNVTRGQESNAGFYVDQTLGLLFLSLLKPPPFDEARSGAIIRALASFGRTVTNGQENLSGKAIKPFAVAAIEKLVDVRGRLTKVADALGPLLTGVSASDLQKATNDASAALETFHDWLNAQLAGMSEDTEVGREAYVYFLKHVALMPFTPEQLLVMGAYEWERSVAFETFEQTRNQGLPELELFPDQEAQIEREVIEEERARKFLEANNILTVPGWLKHYRNLPLPAYLEPLSFMGVTDDLTSATRLDEDGISYIKRPHPDLDYFSLSIAKDPRPLIVHEGVPGHYFQMSLAWAHENTIRRRYYDSGANEGIGFYAEEMMLDAGLYDDSPRSRETIFNFARLRALRVEVDVKLALGQFTIAQAAEYLAHTVPMDGRTAEGEAADFATAPGLGIAYEIGKIQIERMLAERRLERGDKFTLREFHDYLWSNGNVPLSLQRWELLSLDDDIKEVDELTK